MPDFRDPLLGGRRRGPTRVQISAKSEILVQRKPSTGRLSSDLWLELQQTRPTQRLDDAASIAFRHGSSMEHPSVAAAALLANVQMLLQGGAWPKSEPSLDRQLREALRLARKSKARRVLGGRGGWVCSTWNLFDQMRGSSTTFVFEQANSGRYGVGSTRTGLV